MNAYIFPNLSKTNCKEYTVEACEILRECGVSLHMESCYQNEFPLDYVSFAEEEKCICDCDIIIAIGGDGTILQCSVKASRFSKPILGINCGRLGFMASLEASQLGLLRKLAEQDYTVSRRMMLDITVKNPGCSDMSFSALNDAVVARSDDCKIADFEVSKNGQLISSLRADGVIFSTATGATAYSMSAGGPIIEPEMECIEFTQICAHSLFARSMILSASSRVEVKCHTSDSAHVLLNVDGNIVYRLTDGDTVEVVKSKRYVDIIDIIGGSFFSSVNSKLMRPLKDISEDFVK